MNNPNLEKWFIVAGSDGTHRQVTPPSVDRGEVLKRLDWYRTVAPEGLTYRMARQTTTVTTTIEDT